MSTLQCPPEDQDRSRAECATIGPVRGSRMDISLLGGGGTVYSDYPYTLSINAAFDAATRWVEHGSQRRTDAQVVITDTGPGVTDDQLDRLLDRFCRSDAARVRATGGSGLEFAIASAIVETHGGSIALSHNQPHGLVVRIRIPREQTARPIGR
jgi:signal transduction histidine kinase